MPLARRCHRRRRRARALAATVLAAAAGCGAAPKARARTPQPDAAVARGSYTVDVGGGVDVEVSYLRAGDPEGPRVVFVHGTPGSATGWLDFLRATPRGLEFVAVDRPGFGRTRPLRAFPSLDQQAAALAPLLERRGGKWPILVGHSLGAPIVAAVAAREPARVGGLLLVAGSLDPELEEVSPLQLLAEVRPFAWLVPQPLRHANREVLDVAPALARLGARLGDIRCPTVVVHGTEDALVPYANVAYVQRHLTGTDEQLVRLDGFDHFLPWTAPHVLRDAIARLVAGDLAACGRYH